MMSQQMLLIRAREQELLDELDVIMNHRERSLEGQQQSLYRNICGSILYLRFLADGRVHGAALCFRGMQADAGETAWNWWHFKRGRCAVQVIQSFHCRLTT